MEIMKVPLSNIVAMIFTLIIVFGLPILLCVWYRKKYKAQINSFFIGCVTFILAALILEQALHFVVFALAGGILQKNIFLYGLYGGLAAGLFEETGRFIAMKKFMRDKRHSLTRENALMYGAGHGGAEAVLIVGATYINNLIATVMINSGSFAATLTNKGAEEQELMRRSVAPLIEASPLNFYMGGLERALAIVLQISFSVVVYQAVRLQKKSFLGIAIGIHAVIDLVAVVSSAFVPILVVELIMLVMTAMAAAFAYRLYKSETASA